MRNRWRQFRLTCRTSSKRDGSTTCWLPKGSLTPILRTMDYLNEVSTSRFYAVEVVRFGDGNLQAFEARLIKGPPHKATRIWRRR